MNPWRWVDPRIQSLHLASVRDYLEAHGWFLKPSTNPSLLCYEKTSHDNGNQPIRCVIPASERAGDFVQSMTYFITTMSEIEDRHPVAILEDILQFQSASAIPNASGH